MSQHYKPINEIRFEDVEAFCLQKFPEGIRSEYKGDIPNDFGKIVTAFAKGVTTKVTPVEDSGRATPPRPGRLH
jgi:hypothetical protein